MALGVVDRGRDSSLRYAKFSLSGPPGRVLNRIQTRCVSRVEGPRVCVACGCLVPRGYDVSGFIQVVSLRKSLTDPGVPMEPQCSPDGRRKLERRRRQNIRTVKDNSD